MSTTENAREIAGDVKWVMEATGLREGDAMVLCGAVLAFHNHRSMEADLAVAREALERMIDWHERGDAETWPSVDFDRFRHDMDSARQALSHLTPKEPE